MKKAVILRTDGTKEVVDFSTDSLSVLQNAVGGYIEAVDLGDNLTMWLNEEGKLNGLPHNENAQFYFDLRFGPGVDYIVGNAIFTGGTDNEGDTLGLDDRVVESMTSTVLAS